MKLAKIGSLQKNRDGRKRDKVLIVAFLEKKYFVLDVLFFSS